MRYVDARPQDGLVVARGYAAVAGPRSERRGVLAARLFARATAAAGCSLMARQKRLSMPARLNWSASVRKKVSRRIFMNFFLLGPL